jgi:anti-sigma-K factor RskA
MDREAIVSALSVLASAIATENQLPTGLLVTRSALERVARELPKTPEAVAESLEANTWRASLVAGPICALLAGEIALTVQGAGGANPRVVRVPTTGGAEGT